MKIAIEHTTIVTLDDQDSIYEDSCLCIEDKKIFYIGNSIPEEFHPDRIIDGRGGAVMPGLVNAHCHSPMTMFRNFAGGLPLQAWMFENIRPLQQYVSAEEIEACARLAFVEMIKSGTVAFADMYSWSDLIGETAADTGLKALVSGSYGKDNGLAGGIDKEAFRSHSAMVRQRSDGRVQEGILIHALYSVPERQVREVSEFAKEEGLRLQIHVSETKQEIQQIYERYRMSPVEKLEQCGTLDVPCIAAHCVYLKEQDYDILREKKTFVAHCPVSNLKLGSGIADTVAMEAHGIPVCIGTDGVASNNNLNLWKEANYAALLPKGTASDPTVLAPGTVLKWMTAAGYHALGIKDSGCLQAGKNADLIMLSVKEPHFTPVVSWYDALMYSAQASDVRLVICDGKILMENRELKGLDEEKIIQEAKAASERILQHAR